MAHISLDMIYRVKRMDWESGERHFTGLGGTRSKVLQRDGWMGGWNKDTGNRSDGNFVKKHEWGFGVTVS